MSNIIGFPLFAASVWMLDSRLRFRGCSAVRDVRPNVKPVSDSSFDGRIRVVVNGDRVNLELIS